MAKKKTHIFFRIVKNKVIFAYLNLINMKAKPILAILASTVTGFLLGWLIWGILLADFYKTNMVQYNGLMKEPPIWVYFLTNLIVATMFWYVLHHLAGIRSVIKGAAVAVTLTFLATLPIEIMFLAGMNLYSGVAIAADLMANALLGGIMGAVVVAVMSAGNQGAHAES